MGKALEFIKLIKEQNGAGGERFTNGGSIAGLGKIPSPALGVVSKPGTSYKLDVPMIPKKKRMKKKEDMYKFRKLHHKRIGEPRKTYDIDISPGKTTISGVYSVRV